MLATSTFQNCQELSIWSDNGSNHFRIHEMLAEYMKVKQTYPNWNIHINYFREHHGKNICDTHFSVISRAYQQISNCQQPTDSPITADDLVIQLSKHFNEVETIKRYKLSHMLRVPTRSIQVHFNSWNHFNSWKLMLNHKLSLKILLP